MGVRGKDGANYENVDELMKANARWEQQERQNKLLEEQNRLRKQEIQQSEMQRQKEFEKQLELEQDKIYEESRKTDAIEAQTRAIEEQNRIALMTEEEKAIYKVQKEKESYILQLNNKVEGCISTIKRFMSLINTADQEYLNRISTANKQKEMKLAMYEEWQEKCKNKKKIKIERAMSQGILNLLFIGMIVSMILCIIETPSFIGTGITFIIVLFIMMLGSNKFMNWYYSRDYSKKIEELKQQVKPSIIPSLQEIPIFKMWTLDKAINDIDLYKQHILDYMIKLQSTVNQWKDICSRRKEYMEMIGEDIFDNIFEDISEFISFLK